MPRWLTGTPTRWERHHDELTEILQTAADALGTAAHVMLANALLQGVKGELNRGRVMWEQGLTVGRSMRPFVEASEELFALRYGDPGPDSVHAAVRATDPDMAERHDGLVAETRERIYHYVPDQTRGTVTAPGQTSRERTR